MAKKAKSKTKLDKIKLHYLLTNPDGLNNEQMAETLGVTVQTVYNYQKKNKPAPVVETPVAPTPAPQEANAVGPKFDDLMGKARYGRSPDKIVGAVMTAAAAELADASKKSNRIAMSEAMKSAIHQPKRKS